MATIAATPSFGKSVSTAKPTIGLALQGAGAKGAYSWGAIEAFIDSDIHIKALCGASSGAFNAGLAATGLAKGDPGLAKETLERGWMTMSKKAWGTPFRSQPLDKIYQSCWPLYENPMYLMYKAITEHVPQEIWNASGKNIFREVVEECIDFEAIQTAENFDLFIGATDPKQGQIRIYTNSDISAETVLASGGLRKTMPAVNVQGREMWDGGFMENPSVTPLAHNSDVSDIVLVSITPSMISELPTKPGDIETRIQQMLYMSGVYKDMGHIAHMNELIRSGALDPTKCNEREVLLHRVDNQEAPELESSRSCDDLDPDHLLMRRAQGYKATMDWIQENGHNLGKESTFDPHCPDTGPIRSPGYIETKQHQDMLEELTSQVG